MSSKIRRPLTALLFLLPLAVVLAAWLAGWLLPLERSVQDYLYQHPGTPSPRIFVIGIDEETLDVMGPFETWSRVGIAALVEKLTSDPAAAPAVIGLDIGFYGEKNQEDDARLVAACREAGNVVAAGAVTFGPTLKDDAGGGVYARTEAVTLEKPFPALLDAAAWGHTNINLDKDGVARSALGWLPVGGERVESFAETIYRVYTGAAPAIPLDANRQWRIAYSAKPYAYYGIPGAGASLARVLSGEYPASAFAGSIVLVGAYANGMTDYYSTPVSLSERMHGVEVHANLIQAMLEEKYVRTPPLALSVTLCAAVWGIAMALFLRARARFSLPLALLLLAGYGVAAVLCSYRQLFLPFVAPVLGGISLIGVHLALKYIGGWWERRRIIASFSRYLPPQVARGIAERGEEALRLGGTKRGVAVLFVDIRGFTALAEQLPPERIVTLLNQYLRLTTVCVFHHQGTVDKFIGDATMALFNAPGDVTDYVYEAVGAAFEMMENSAVLNASLAADGVDGIAFGIGIHCGEAVVGNIGTEFRMEYTAIGDTVNTASRLEGLAEAGEILISEAVYRHVKDRFVCAYLGERVLRGKREPVPVWRLERPLERGEAPDGAQ